VKIAFLNLPWPGDDKNPRLWGVRAGSRWPHFQQRPPGSELPRYVPFPFFMASAAAYARNSGHDVLLIDSVAEPSDFDSVRKRLSLFKPQLVFAETSTPSLENDLALLRKIKKDFPDAPIVCAGSHSPHFALELMKKENLPDFWIAGEYDFTVSELASAMEKGVDPASVAGVFNASNKNVPAFASVKDLDSLPEPLFEALPVANYSDPVCGLPSPSGQTFLSRGCPFKCSFCVWPQVVYGNRSYRTRSIEKALAEVETLINTYKCESFYFDDDTANIGEERMKFLASEIVRRKLNIYPWAMMARADCMTDPMLEALAAAGLYAVKYGVESVSPALTDACGKGTNLEKFRRAIEKTKSLGIKMHLTFTFGLPGETPETIDETVDFAIKTAPESAQFSICTPFPGTDFFEECVRNGWLTTSDWKKFTGDGCDAVIGTPALSADRLLNSYASAMKKWNSFLTARTQKRKDSLVAKLKKALSSGSKFRFLGDRDFADFIFNDPALSAAESDSAPLTVIVSRHDEERIFRRHLRRDPTFSALRLFN